MGQRVKDQDDELMSEINIVPFVDIILVILIIFMVTAPIIMKPSLKIQLPESSSGDKTKHTPFQLIVASKNEISLNGKKINFEQIKALAADYASQNPDGQAIISADESVPHGDVVSVLDQIKAGGLKRLGISTRTSNQ